MGRVTRMEYPHGWVEEYTYDAIGQLLNVTDSDPSGKDMKEPKHVYQYNDCGNMVYEYMRGNGTGEATVENDYAYDALHRVIRAEEHFGHEVREYTYDSLGNLTYEKDSHNYYVDYILNNLNQIVESSTDGWKTQTSYTYDGRGNLTEKVYGKNKKVTTTAEYIFDETNKMVLGYNALRESSAYTYNGLGALVENTWVIAKNGYGYHDVSAIAEGEELLEPDAGLSNKGNNKGNGNSSGNNGQGNGNAAGNGDGNGSINKTSTVVKQFVVDYNTETFEPLMEHEVNGLDYKYVYGNDRLSVDISPINNSGHIVENGDHVRLYYHMDYLGTTDYLTSPVSGKVEAWTHYNEWGLISHNAVLKCGQQELDLVKRYATHDYDSVLELYYAKARFYDAHDRHFTAVDPILDPSGYDLREYVQNPVQLVQYLYVVNNPIIFTDLLGLNPTNALLNIDWSKVLTTSGNADNVIGQEQYVSLDSVWKQIKEYYPSAYTYSKNGYSVYTVSDGGNYIQFQKPTNKNTIEVSMMKNGKVETHSLSLRSILNNNFVSKNSLERYFRKVWCEDYYLSTEDGPQLSMIEQRAIVSAVNFDLAVTQGKVHDTLQAFKNYLITGRFPSGTGEFPSISIEIMEMTTAYERNETEKAIINIGGAAHPLIGLLVAGAGLDEPGIDDAINFSILGGTTYAGWKFEQKYSSNALNRLFKYTSMGKTVYDWGTADIPTNKNMYVEIYISNGPSPIKYEHEVDRNSNTVLAVLETAYKMVDSPRPSPSNDKYTYPAVRIVHYGEQMFGIDLRRQ